MRCNVGRAVATAWKASSPRHTAKLYRRRTHSRVSCFGIDWFVVLNMCWLFESGIGGDAWVFMSVRLCVCTSDLVCAWLRVCVCGRGDIRERDREIYNTISPLILFDQHGGLHVRSTLWHHSITAKCWIRHLWPLQFTSISRMHPLQRQPLCPCGTGLCYGSWLLHHSGSSPWKRKDPCVCKREREREREGLCVCVCVWVCEVGVKNEQKEDKWRHEDKINENTVWYHEACIRIQSGFPLIRPPDHTRNTCAIAKVEVCSRITLLYIWQTRRQATAWGMM